MILTNREKFLILILGFVMISAVYLNFLFFPMLKKIHGNLNVLKEKSLILNILQQEDEGDLLHEQEIKMQEEMKNIESVLPTQARIPEIYLDILSIANKTGIQQKSFTIQSPKFEEISTSNNNEEKFSNKLMKFSINHIFTGNYSQIKNYMDEIQKLDRKINIIEYQFKNLDLQENENQLLANVTLESYALVKERENYSKFIDYDFIKDHNYGREDPFTLKGEYDINEEDPIKNSQDKDINSNIKNE